MDTSSRPKIIFLISGKRKSGKDHVSESLFERLGGDNAVIIRLSAPIKLYWAKSNHLQLNELMTSGEYKENYRKAMITWSENVRNSDYGYFCRAAIEMVTDAVNKGIWIVSDTRRETDIKWFTENYKDTVIKTIRIVTSDEIRKQRGWKFVKGIDDGESECDLDSIEEWGMLFYNNNDDKEFETQFNILIDMCNSMLI